MYSACMVPRDIEWDQKMTTNAGIVYINFDLVAKDSTWYSLWTRIKVGSSEQHCMVYMRAQFSALTRLQGGQMRNHWIPGRGNRFVLFFKVFTLVQLSHLLNGYWELCLPQYSSWNMKFTTYLHLVPRLRMSGSVSPQLLYVFMACREIILPLLFQGTFSKDL